MSEYHRHEDYKLGKDLGVYTSPSESTELEQQLEAILPKVNFDEWSAGDLIHEQRGEIIKSLLALLAQEYSRGYKTALWNMRREFNRLDENQFEDWLIAELEKGLEDGTP